jgi:hypothetical protein
VNESLVLKNIVCELESHRDSSRAIDELAHAFGIKRQGLYDFIRICTVFGICRLNSSNDLEWFGLQQSSSAIDQIRMDLETEGEKRELSGLFDYSIDPSLPRISVAVVKLFFFLNVRYLDLRKVGKLFAKGKTKYKTMLRKLYTVVAGLEMAGIVNRTHAVSEIHFNPPLQNSMNASQFRLLALLNSPQELAREQAYERRRKEFDQICVESVGQSIAREKFHGSLNLPSAMAPIRI